MKIIIAGIGNIGAGLAGRLLNEGHDIVLVDRDIDRLEYNEETQDVMTVKGTCAAMETLRKAGVEDADLLITATSSDEKNLLSCMTAHGMNPDIKTVARVRMQEYLETTSAFGEAFGLSMIIDPGMYAAKDIEAILTCPGFMHRERFTKGMTDVVEAELHPESELCGKPVSAIQEITGSGALVCVVKRGDTAITPGRDFVLREMDRIYVTAEEEDLSNLLKLFGKKRETVEKVIIVGGGRIAKGLIPRLRKEGMEITVIDTDKEICEELALEFPKVTVVHGDGRKFALLERKNIREQDALICLTNDDESNAVLATFANLVKVPLSVIKLKDINYAALLNKIDNVSVINPNQLCGDVIVRFVRALIGRNSAAVSVRSIADGNAQIAEFVVGSGMSHCGEQLKDIKFKKNVILASINRRGKNILPDGESMFLQGDRVLAVFSRDDIKKFDDLFR